MLLNKAQENAIDIMPLDLQRYCVELLIGEHDARTMPEKLVVPFLKMTTLFKPEFMSAIAEGFLEKVKRGDK